MNTHSKETDLPIIQITYQVSLDYRKSLEKFPRAHKISLGEYTANCFSQFLEKIIQTNHLTLKDKRLQNLKDLMALLLSIRLHIRMAKDLRCLSKGQFADFSRKLDDIQRQLIGWHKWVKSKLDSAPQP